MVEELSKAASWPGWREARAVLFRLRENGERKSQLVVELGGRLLANHSGRLGDEAWSVHEQVLTAALDCADDTIAEVMPTVLIPKRSLKALKRRFPGSMRVKRLEGMQLEAQGKYDEALELYSEALEAHPTNSTLWKRKVAVYKATGDIVEAIRELNSFLEVFMNDREAWMELADLYTESNDYEKAAFCWEELVLAQPHHHLFHQRYAEVCYTLGSVEGLELARKHFAVAAKLNADSVRALYGFFMASHALAIHPKVKSRDVKETNRRYMDWAKGQLQQKYLDNGKLRVVERMLDKLEGSR